MGKKQKNKKRGVTLTLSEFNEEGGGDPELLSLPSAPKAPEEWEALGGKPEYNLRGYRERTPGGPSRGGMGGRLGGGLGGRDYGMHGGQGDDLDDRDWSRRGPLDTEEHEQRGERDWGDMRRAQSMNQQHQEEAERDWNDMRRGPVDSSFRGMSGGDAVPGAEPRDWTQRRGPMEAAMDQGQFAQQPEADWSVARGGHVVEAKFNAEGGPFQERDWSQRKGPVEAQQQNVGGAQQHGIAQQDDQDWAAPRKGPVESEFVESAPPVEERDWSERRGPVEAAVPDAGANGAGSGNTASANNQELDWSERRGPVEAVQKPAQNTSPSKHGSSILNPPPFDDDDDDDDQDWAAVRMTATPVAPPTEAASKPTTAAETASMPVRESAQTAGAGQEDGARSEWTRRGPVQSKAEVQQEQMQRRSENGEHRDRGFGGRHRRGGGGSGSFFGRNMSESADSDGLQTGTENQQGSGSGSWRRDAGTGVVPRGGGGRRSRGSVHPNRPTSVAHDDNGGGFAHANGGGHAGREHHHHREQERERDWGAARRSMPEGRQARNEAVSATVTAIATNDEDGAGGEQEHDDQRSGPVVGGSGEPPGSADRVEETIDPANQQAEEQQQGEDVRGGAGGVEDDEWTTVRASTRRDMRLSRRGSASSGRWRGASGGRSGGAGSNGGGYRSSFNSNSMTNQRSFDRSNAGRSGDDTTSRANSSTSRGSDGRAVFLERKRAGFNHLNSINPDADADETDGDLADADDADDDEHAKNSRNGDVSGSMAKMKSGGRFGPTSSPPTMGGGANTQVQ